MNQYKANLKKLSKARKKVTDAHIALLAVVDSISKDLGIGGYNVDGVEVFLTDLFIKEELGDLDD